MGTGLAAGAAGFVARPFSEGELRAEVAAALERRPTCAYAQVGVELAAAEGGSTPLSGEA